VFRPFKICPDTALPLLMGLSLALFVGSHQQAYAIPSQALLEGAPQEPKTAPSSEANIAPKGKALSPAEQGKFLSNRLPGNVIGNLGNFASLLFVMEGTAIGSSSKDVLHRPLQTVYPNREIYKPTYGEFFDMLARQTRTSYKYLPEVNVWLFDEPSMPLPYTVKKADGWKEEDHGMYVAYIPPVALMGMDIYMMGNYSDLSDAQIKEVRDIAALRFSKKISEKVTISDMMSATVDGADAIYFESAAPEPDRLWRQWAFYKHNQVFVIVSAYSKENKDKIVPDVDAMIKSFHVRE
jgi:hypothetical protein